MQFSDTRIFCTRSSRSLKFVSMRFYKFSSLQILESLHLRTLRAQFYACRAFSMDPRLPTNIIACSSIDSINNRSVCSFYIRKFPVQSKQMCVFRASGRKHKSVESASIQSLNYEAFSVNPVHRAPVKFQRR